MISKSLFCFVIISLIQFNLCAQNVEVVSLDSLESSLQYFYNLSWTSERVEFVKGEKGKVLNYLPSVGFTFGLPAISFGTDKIVKMRKDKKDRISKLEAIDKKYFIIYNEMLQKLRLEYKKLEVEKRKILVKEKLFEIESKLFEITQEGFDKLEITPEQYLIKLKDYKQKKEVIQIEKLEYEIKILELYELAKFKLPNQELAIFDSNNFCIPK